MANGNPFGGLTLFSGESPAVTERRMAEAGADRRLGRTLGAAEAERQRQERLVNEANSVWQGILGRHAAGTTDPITGNPTGPAGMFDAQTVNTAMREFVTTPEFMRLPVANARGYVDIVRAIQTNPNAPFTVSPGQEVFRDSPTGVQGPEARVEPRPGPRVPGPLDAPRADLIKNWMAAGQTAADLSGALTELERLVATPGGTGQTFQQFWNTQRARLGLPANTTTAQTVEALRTRLVQAMHTAGMGPMTDADRAAYERALPSIGNNRQANQIILDILTRNSRMLQARGELAREALEINTPGAVDTAIRTAGNPALMRERQHTAEARWVAETFGVPEAELNPRTITALETLTRRLQESGRTLPPRAIRFLRELATRIDVAGR